MNCRISLGLASAIAALSSFAQIEPKAPLTVSTEEFEKTVNHDFSFVKRKYPNAKLFQVAIFGLIPEALSQQKTIDSTIQSWYDVGAKDHYVQATHLTLRKSDAGPEVMEVSLETCQKPYPRPDSQVCASPPGISGVPAVHLTLQTVSGLGHLSDWIAKAGLDASDRYDVTITAVGQFGVQGSSPESLSSAQALSALAQSKPQELIFSVTDRGGKDKSKTGTTIVFDASTGEVLGRFQAVKRRLPPSGRP